MQKTNLGESVRQRILNEARRRGEDNNSLLTRYAIERLLYRLGQSQHRDRFVLKGAALYLVWLRDSPQLRYRATRDVDFWSSGSPDVEGLLAVFREVLQAPVEEDALRWPLAEMRGTAMREDADYEGCRLSLVAYLDAARIPVQIDFGFGDAITPTASEVEYPTLLPAFPAPRLRAYPRETVVAEKLQALVLLDLGNSRLKDFFDLWTLAQNFDFDGAILQRAIAATFERRQTALPNSIPVALTPRFTRDAAKVAAWRAFARRNRMEDVPELEKIAAQIAPFVMPALQAVQTGRPLEWIWRAGQGWN